MFFLYLDCIPLAWKLHCTRNHKQQSKLLCLDSRRAVITEAVKCLNRQEDNVSYVFSPTQLQPTPLNRQDILHPL